ncbi:hypothetical protein SmJEL517_g03962 [Synchytrium microbalum]|uniref:Protein LTV1 n=1 Tax=Synchytrium microbalum TaxID=1806994 RepID=A0A507BU12_9FUNG|nr:uncharacterized protein SmJEL517_g03962 [Synchytrium microbalum]TPX33000.1 hypothetical protein SmJEL517_g03962 [Synchytrium microbalum]
MSDPRETGNGHGAFPPSEEFTKGTTSEPQTSTPNPDQTTPTSKQVPYDIPTAWTLQTHSEKHIRHLEERLAKTTPKDLTPVTIFAEYLDGEEPTHIEQPPTNDGDDEVEQRAGSISSSELSFVKSDDSRASLLTDESYDDDTTYSDNEEDVERGVPAVAAGAGGNSRSRQASATRQKIERLRDYSSRYYRALLLLFKTSKKLSRTSSTMGKKPFIDKTTARHFQVVHRSQRDPALSDESASRYVLREVAPSNNLVKAWKGRYQPDEELDDDLHDIIEDGDFDSDQDEDEWGSEAGAENVKDDAKEDPVLDDDQDENWEDVDEEGTDEDQEQPEEDDEASITEKPTTNNKGKQSKKEDASLYGIYFDDQDSYDYTQHMKPIGEDPSAVYIDAKPNARNEGASNTPSSAPTAVSTSKKGIAFIDDDAASAMGEEPRRKRHVNFVLPEEALASRDEEGIGLLHRGVSASGLRLDLDPNVREVLEALEDDTFVDDDGEAAEDFFAALNADVVPEGLQLIEDENDDEDEDDDEQPAWVSEFKREDDDDEDDEPDHKTATTSFSMSSSSIYRNPGKILMDDRFEHVLEDYSDTEIGELDSENPSVRGIKLVSDTRVNQIMDDFLDSVETRGRKNILITKRDGLAQMNEIRNELKGDGSDPVPDVYDIMDEEDEEVEISDRDEEDEGRGWDAETILSTYSNIYHRPKIIDDDEGIRIAVSRHGVRVVTNNKGTTISSNGRLQIPSSAEPVQKQQAAVAVEEDDEGSEARAERVNRGQARRKDETPEEKRARKEAVKAERRDRRETKKGSKHEFKHLEEQHNKKQLQREHEARTLHIE